MMGPTKHVPDWRLERFLLHELSNEDQADLARQIDADHELQQRVADLERDNAEILSQYPAPEMARQIERRRHREDTAQTVARRQRRWGGSIGVVTVMAGAAAVLMLAVPEPQTGESDDSPLVEVTRAKGPAELYLHRVTAGQQKRLVDGDIAGAGDKLQVSYRSDQQRYAAIVSVDGNGSVTVHFPNGPKAGALDIGGFASLDHSYWLDDAPRFEVFFLVTAREPFAVATVTKAAADILPALDPDKPKGARLPLPAGLEQQSLWLKKTNPRPGPGQPR